MDANGDFVVMSIIMTAQHFNLESINLGIITIFGRN